MFGETKNCIEKYDKLNDILVITFVTIGVFMLIGGLMTIMPLLEITTEETTTLVIIIIIAYVLYVLSCIIILMFIQWQKLMLSNLHYISKNIVETQKQDELEYSTN